MFNLLEQHDFEELPETEEAKQLANAYVAHGIIPAKYIDDAIHIAIASINNIDVIISWNFRHIVKLKTKREVASLNLSLGYDPIDICSPWEVIDHV